MNSYSTLPVIYKIIFLSFSTHFTFSSNSQLPYEIFSNKSQRLPILHSLQTPNSHMRFFPINLKDYHNVWSKQEEGFERTTAAAMAKKISVTKKALIPGFIKPSRMSKGHSLY
ncbi:hypothetical protein ES332_D12G139800v1 [Gossypium tomentosum]|uniref:Uncharacterized protein n=1 Tax=Gossypium tomentosum TaxID=34277 RepID=A0A5D2I908_GOSTO|nr:hypothetical protein ES332_D12G139800v1 [Gossypium tomentosum]